MYLIRMLWGLFIQFIQFVIDELVRPTKVHHADCEPQHLANIAWSCQFLRHQQPAASPTRWILLDDWQRQLRCRSQLYLAALAVWVTAPGSPGSPGSAVVPWARSPLVDLASAAMAKLEEFGSKEGRKRHSGSSPKLFRLQKRNGLAWSIVNLN